MLSMLPLLRASIQRSHCRREAKRRRRLRRHRPGEGRRRQVPGARWCGAVRAEMVYTQLSGGGGGGWGMRLRCFKPPTPDEIETGQKGPVYLLEKNGSVNMT